MEKEHAKVLEQLKAKAEASRTDSSTRILEWFNAQIPSTHPPTTVDIEEARAKEQRDKEIQDIKAQQEALSRKLAELEGTKPTDTPKNPDTSHELLLQQLKSALSSKQEEDPNKALLKALITSQNKVTGEGGTNTLKPTILNGLLNPEGGNSMAEWLASLNKQEEGESELTKLLLSREGELKAAKVKSGILNKATTNIQQKQVWPQQNLGEDWADEDVGIQATKI